MSNKANNVAPLYKRVVIFVVGMPGYLLTFIPWTFVVALIFVLAISYSKDGTLTIPLEAISYQSAAGGFTELASAFMLSFGLWVFVAWMTKRILLMISRLFGVSEKTWLIVKCTALISAWSAVLATGFVFFSGVTSNFFVNAIGMVFVGCASIALEYLLETRWLSLKT